MKKERTGCIYMITCIPNGRFYIGLTINNVKYRWSDHMRNSCNINLRKDVSKFGKDNFIKEVLFDSIPKKDLNQLEVDTIYKLNPFYNISKGGNRGNGAEGEEHWNSVITKEDVLKIRELNKTGNYTHKELSTLFKIGRAEVGRILTGLRWKSVGGYIEKPKSMSGEGHPNSKLTKSLVEEMRNIGSLNKYTLKELGIKYNISYQHVSAILRGNKWKTAKGPIKGVDY